MAYEAIEPFGHHMENLRAGLIAATILNANRTKKFVGPLDFFKPKGEKKPALSGAEIANQMRALLTAAGEGQGK